MWAAPVFIFAPLEQHLDDFGFVKNIKSILLVKGWRSFTELFTEVYSTGIYIYTKE